MCPSYMVTREEKDSTRGRARMLFEMMNGEVIDDGWKSEEVKEALDLCLSCKGCKGDCPVNVDMATYKSEFLSHYYEGRLRPRHAYAFGWIHIWSSLAVVAPSVANLFTQLPGLSSIAKLVAGVHPNRKIPAFAPQSFKQWFKSHEAENPDGPPVVLFADTFNNHFHPDVAIAATRSAGRRRLPRPCAHGGRLLRPAALRLRISRDGQALVDRSARETAAVLSQRHSDGRAGAELLGGVQGRIVQPDAQQRRRQAAQRADLHPQRFSALAMRRLSCRPS